jgi:hypothetical protein
MTENSAPSLIITRRVEAIRKTIKIQNGPNIIITLELPIQSDIRVWRETNRWNRPFKLLVTESETYLIVILYNPIKFRTTIIKLYYQEQFPE